MTDASEASAEANAEAEAAKAAEAGAGAEAGSAEATNGSSDQGSSNAAADPLAGLEAGSREWAETNGIKSMADAVKTAREAQSLIGKSLRVPDEKATDEEWSEFYSKATAKLRPEKPEGYEFALPEGVPDNMPYDEDFAKSFKEQAHEAGLTKKQAATLHDFYVKFAGEQFSSGVEDLKQTAETATATLEKEFGGKRDSQEFKNALEITARGVRELGGEELLDALSKRNLIDKSGLILEPSIAVAMYRAGKALFTEDSLETGAPGGTVGNPFKDGPGKGDLTQQMAMIRQDPERARRMMQQAGHDPAGWFGKQAT